MRRLALIVALCAASLAGAAIAQGDVVQSGKVIVNFGGGFSPQSLPRAHDVPISVSLKGTVRTSDGSPTPQLRKMSIAVNRHGRIYTAGLPRCEASRLESTNTALALSRCRQSVVGRGSLGATLNLANGDRFPVRGKMLAFISRDGNRPGMLVHIHVSTPASVTVVLSFKMKKVAKGKFGTLLTTRVPRIAADLGYVTDISLDFAREYRYLGKPRSFISARCAAPPGFPGALFTFARATFEFADNDRIVTNLTRDCVVR